MPIALLIIGLLFLIAAVRGKHDDLFLLLKDDFTGPGNFIYWVIALWVIGAVGYYRPFKPLSVAFMTLIILVLFLSNKGFFRQFMAQISATTYEGGGATRDFGFSILKPGQAKFSDLGDPAKLGLGVAKGFFKKIL